MKIVECQQYDDLWWEARRGIPTASAFDRIITAGGKPSGQARKYICELLGDLYCQNPNFFREQKRASTWAMEHGTNCEPEARRWYEFERGVEVRQVGFLLSDCGRYGASPDGVVGDDGLLELKCPLPKTHVEYLLDGTLPADYRPQVHGQLVVTGRKWVDFVSYASGFEPLVVRVTPDAYTDQLRVCLDRFLLDYEAAKVLVAAPAARPEGVPA